MLSFGVGERANQERLLVVIARECLQHAELLGWRCIRKRRNRRFEPGERGGCGDPYGVNGCGGVWIGVERGVDADGIGKGERREGRDVWEDEGGGKVREEDCVGFEELESRWLD